ncbi:MAG: PD-(D/E)XK nuclease family protein [Burkholderiales bacterium]|nr:PD-(D/E)XK nuclease family protein [Burkholderiales bacterium]
MNAIAQSHRPALLRELMRQVRELITQRGAHPARTVVLLPYAQLMAPARRLWSQEVPQGFAPRFETTMNWAGAAGFVPRADDIAFDMGRDLLTAHALMQRAGLGSHAELLAGRLVELGWQLAAVAAAVLPPQRPAWAARQRPLVSAGMEGPQLALEAALARVALEWAAASAYAGDALLADDLAASIDLLVVLEGFQAEPLAATLQTLLGAKAATLRMDGDAAMGDVLLHQAGDPSDEAERAAACVLAHVEAGRVPVALAAIDRVLTRRIRAMLDARGIQIRDETGWKLSTTRSAARLMAGLRACAWNAGTDAVLDWLKNIPAAPANLVPALERRVRRSGLREWQSLRAADLEGSESLAALHVQVAQWREDMARPRPLTQWLAALRAQLQATQLWDALQLDAAGEKIIAALRLQESAQAELEQLPQAARRLPLAGFTAWVNDTLEAASFVPEPPAGEEVVILPFNQLLGRPFAALVLPGCDEVRLAPSPEPPGPWSAAQREGLGLPSREALEAAVREGWRCALQTPHSDVLWRASDDSGEVLLPSPLVLALQLQHSARPGTDPRPLRELTELPTPRPQAVAAALPLAEISASAYEDLRRCPYRFFALRQLGLKEADELDGEIGKRDFGNWLHAVLSRFHEAQLADPLPHGAQREARLNALADEVTRSQRLDEGEFLPFSAAWPRARQGYLDWLAGHEAGGPVFEQAESEHRMPLGELTLVGRIDRVDRLPDGAVLVMDYKTEDLQKTKKRVKDAGEDTQLTFYAALLHDDTLRAAYVNVGERGETLHVEQPDVIAARDDLVAALIDDMQRIAQGEAMAALGEGTACEFCAARGLCRRDFWT